MNDLLAGSGEAAPEGELDAELLAMEADLLPSVPAAEPPAAEPQHAEVSTAPTDDEWPALALPAGGEPADGAAAAASDAALQEATTGSAAAGAGDQEQLGSIRDEVRTTRLRCTAALGQQLRARTVAARDGGPPRSMQHGGVHEAWQSRNVTVCWLCKGI